MNTIKEDAEDMCAEAKGNPVSGAAVSASLAQGDADTAGSIMFMLSLGDHYAGSFRASA